MEAGEFLRVVLPFAVALMRKMIGRERVKEGQMSRLLGPARYTYDEREIMDLETTFPIDEKRV